MGHTLDGSRINSSCPYSIAFYLGDKFGAQSRYPNVIVRNVTVSHWIEGIQLNNANNFLLDKSVLKGNNQAGLEVHTSSNIKITNNSFIGNRLLGIVGMDNENVLISNNVIAGNSNIGLNVMGKTMKKAPLELNIFGQQIRFFSEFISLESRTSGGGYTISNNEIKNNANEGIFISGSAFNVVRDNLITGNGQNGVHLIGVDNSVISNNTFINNRAVGIRSESRGINLIFENNTFSGNKDEIKTSYSTFSNFPTSAIFGTIIVYLFSLLGGTTKILEKVVANRGIRRFSEKFKPYEEKISTTLNNSKISVILKNNIAVSLLGAVIFGAAFTFISGSAYVNIIEVFAILTLIGGVVVIVPKGVQYLAANREGMSVEYRLWWGGLLVIALSTLLLGGKIFGQPVRTAIERENEYERKKLALVKIIGPFVSIILSVSFFLLYVKGGIYASLAWTGLNMSLLTAVVSFLPIAPMEGEYLYKWNKLVWGIFFILLVIAYGYIVIIQ
jgi:parallel beta-helix repeat protein